MKKMICMVGLLALTSCSHFGGCHKTGHQCDMKKAGCSKCGTEKDNSQCPMEKAAAPAAEAPKK